MRVKNHMKRIKPQHTSFARKLRQNQTDVEKILWYKLRNKQVENIKFRRQYVIGEYIADFISVEKKLIIELDGGQHNEESAKNYDQKRTIFLENKGYKVLRFWNNEVLENLPEVLESIRKATLHPHPNPLP